ncbi:MAG: hypothetical protein M1840_008017 [Geoglossum simile]|nr:MAG: hypothetical protein M1840_008017 [Geoglossum simile]
MHLKEKGRTITTYRQKSTRQLQQLALFYNKNMMRCEPTQIRKQKKASKKRKRIPGEQEQTVSEMRKALRTPKRQGTTRRTAQQPKQGPTPSDSETDPDSPYEVCDDDMNSSVTVVAPQ